MTDRPRFRDSAAILLVRGRGSDLSVYWVKRGEAVSFMPGFHAFVGGVVGPGDELVPVRGPGDAREHALRVCAVRETFEEIGILIARGGERDPAALADARECLLSGENSFEQLAREHRWEIHAEDLAFAGRWMTPPFATRRFDTTYFLARPPDDAVASIEDGELESGEWIRPSDAIARWKQDEAIFAAPILQSLIELADGERDLATRLATAPERIGQPPRRIELMWGVVLHPVRTKPLPPATHTNAYLVGEGDMALIDPGSDVPEELEALDRLIETLRADGRTLACVLVTHAHADHVAGIEAVRTRYRVPVMGHPDLRESLRLDRVLQDGDRVSLQSPRADWNLVALHTPGHAREHVCYLQQRSGALFSGDHVIGGGTVIIDPPGGDMRAYMSSLERLEKLPIRVLFPGHGSPQGAAARRIRSLLAHRRERESRVIEVLTAAPQGLDDMLERVYSDTPSELWPLARRSLLAHLLKLEFEGLALRTGEAWRQDSPE